MEPPAPWVKSPAPGREPSTTPLALGPPGGWVHLALVPVALCLLYAVSSPGWSFLAAMVGFGGVALWTLAWLVLALAYGAERLRSRGRRGDHARSAAWLLLGPALVGILAAAVLTGAPLRARFALARGDFDQVRDRVATVSAGQRRTEAGTLRATVDAPHRIGTYRVHEVSLVPAGVFFHLRTGGIGFHDGGFAHLPDGPPGGDGPLTPSNELGGAWFETMTFWALGDGWYAWEAVQ